MLSRSSRNVEGRFCGKVLRCAKRIGGGVTSVDGAVGRKDSSDLNVKVYKVSLFFKLYRCCCIGMEKDGEKLMVSLVVGQEDVIGLSFSLARSDVAGLACSPLSSSQP